MAFFTQEYLQFFKDLAPNNHKEWFHENKKRYEKHVKIPFEKFVGHMINRLGDFDSDLKSLQPKECIFRINRDVRFSKDKDPYKLQMSAIIAVGGRKHMTNPGIYIEFTPEHARVYSGVYMPDKDQLLQMRQYIASHQKAFEKAVADPKFNQHFPKGILGDKNKILPADLKAAAEKEPLLYNKQFYWYAQLAPEIILDDQVDQVLIEHYLASKPLIEFFQNALAK